MKKFIVLILLCIIYAMPVLSEGFPPVGKGILPSRETNPIYWGYMEDYAKELKKAMESKRFFRLRGWGTSYEYIITRDGEIKNIHVSVPQNNYFDKKIEEIILSVKPLPFREGMELDEMVFDTFLGFYHNPRMRFSIGSYDNANTIKIFSLIVETKK